MIVIALYFIIPSKKKCSEEKWDGSDIDGGLYGIEDNYYPYEYVVTKKKSRKKTSKAKTKVKAKTKKPKNTTKRKTRRKTKP